MGMVGDIKTGSEMTDEDVKWNIEKVQEPENTLQLKGTLGGERC